jgi:ABC-2 type transport system permease protein
MTWQAVARKDFRDSLRSRWLWVISVIFVGLFIGSAYFLGSNLNGSSGKVTSDAFLGLLGDKIVALLIPLIALVVAYSAIIGERKSGTMKLLLSLPHSRQDVIVGKAVGRSGVVTVPILLGLVVAAVVLVVYGVSIKLMSYLLFTFLTIALGVVFVSLAVGISAAASTNRRAMVGSVGLYVLFTVFWKNVRSVLLMLNNKLSLGWNMMNMIEYGLFVKFFNPVRAYQTLVAALYANSTLQARLYDAGRIGPLIAKRIGTAPFYLSDSVVVAQFLLWLLIPIAIGYYIFKNTDL